MSAPSQHISVVAPGNQGLNTELSPFQANQDFALRADNAVIDRVGRLSSREAFADHVTRTDVTGNYDIVRITTLEADEIDKEVVFGIAGKGRPIRSKSEKAAGMESATTFDLGLTDFTEYVGVVVDGDIVREVPAVSPSNGLANCQLVPFKDAIYIFSKGDAPMVYMGGSATKLSDAPNYLPPTDVNGVPYSEEIDGDVACAAYGRLWVSGVGGDYDRIYYSDLLIAEQWYDGTAAPDDEQNTAGIINVAEYWPTGGDKIQGIAAHNGFLIIFGRHSVLIYSGAQGDPAAEGGLKLEDAIRDVGLVNQDAMCNIGSDHLFVDNLGVRALGRVIQEKSSPLAEPSLNVSTDIRARIDGQSDTVRMFNMPRKSLAVCLFPEDSEAYVFQLGQPSASGGLRVTLWTGCDFYDGTTTRTDDGTLSLLAGRNSRGVTNYSGYSQPVNYTLRYESPVINAAGNVMTAMMPKSMSYSFYSRRQYGLNATWGFGALMKYSRPVKSRNKTLETEFQTSSVSVNGSGEMLRVGFDVEISGDPIAMQQISINAQAGRTIV